MFDTRSDQERATTTAPAPIRPRYTLTCPAHNWGQWMTVPFGRAGDFRRCCARRGCKAEQLGQGTAWGGNIRPLNYLEG